MKPFPFMNSLNSLHLIGVRSPRGALPGRAQAPGPLGVRSPLEKLCPFHYMLYKMENMKMPELKALTRERKLRGYSHLRKAELMPFSKIMNIRPRDDRGLHRFLLGDQIDFHRCLLGNRKVNKYNPN